MQALRREIAKPFYPPFIGLKFVQPEDILYSELFSFMIYWVQAVFHWAEVVLQVVVDPGLVVQTGAARLAIFQVAIPFWFVA